MTGLEALVWIVGIFVLGVVLVCALSAYVTLKGKGSD